VTSVTWPEVTCHVTGSDVSNVTGSGISHVPCPEVCYAHAQPGVAPYPPEWGLLTAGDKVTWPEVALSGSGPGRKYVLRIPRFFRVFFFLSSNMATGCDPRSLDPLRGSLGVHMRNRKLRNTRSNRRSREPFGSVLVMFSTTSASYDPRKPRIIYLAWWLELALVICPLYFGIVSRLCSTLLRVHLKISICKNVLFFLFLHF
jgi:hypothetical protein